MTILFCGVFWSFSPLPSSLSSTAWWHPFTSFRLLLIPLAVHSAFQRSLCELSHTSVPCAICPKYCSFNSATVAISSLSIFNSFSTHHWSINLSMIFRKYLHRSTNISNALILFQFPVRYLYCPIVSSALQRVYFVTLTFYELLQSCKISHN